MGKLILGSCSARQMSYGQGYGSSGHGSSTARAMPRWEQLYRMHDQKHRTIETAQDRFIQERVGTTLPVCRPALLLSLLADLSPSPLP